MINGDVIKNLTSFLNKPTIKRTNKLTKKKETNKTLTHTKINFRILNSTFLILMCCAPLLLLRLMSWESANVSSMFDKEL